MVCVAVAALMAVAASEPPASRTPGPEARDAVVVQRALVQSGSVETYFGVLQNDSYVVVVPVAQPAIYWRDWRDWRDVWVAALAEAGGRSAEVQSALSDLEARGKRPWSTPVIDWGSHLRLAAEDPFTAYKRDGTWTDVYPGALGVISVAAPGFSGSGRTAVVYWTRTHSKRCSHAWNAGKTGGTSSGRSLSMPLNPATVSPAPNMRVQRTRSSPSAHRSPLTRYPLGRRRARQQAARSTLAPLGIRPGEMISES